VDCGPGLELEELGPFALFCLTSNHSSSTSELLTPTPSSLLLSVMLVLPDMALPSGLEVPLSWPCPCPWVSVWLWGVVSGDSTIPLFCHVVFFLGSFRPGTFRASTGGLPVGAGEGRLSTAS
jgi:hypothetical protein